MVGVAGKPASLWKVPEEATNSTLWWSSSCLPEMTHDTSFQMALDEAGWSLEVNVYEVSELSSSLISASFLSNGSI